MSTSRTILDASRDNDLEELKRHLEKNPSDVNARDHEGNTPLHLAAKNRNKEAITLLIQHGAYVEIKNKKGQTPGWVSHLKNFAEIRELISSEAKKYDATVEELIKDQLPEADQADLNRYNKIYNEFSRKKDITTDDLTKIFNYYLLFKNLASMIGVNNPETRAGKKADELRDKMKVLFESKKDNSNQSNIPPEGSYSTYCRQDSYIQFLVNVHGTSNKSSHYATKIPAILESFKDTKNASFNKPNNFVDVPTDRLTAIDNGIKAIKKQTPIDIIGFDFDGTLTKTEGSSTIRNQLYKNVFDSNDRKKTSDQIAEDIKNIDDKDGFFNMPDGAIAYLRKQLQNENCKVVIISKNYKEYIEAILKHNGITPKELKALTIIDANGLNIIKDKEAKEGAMENFVRGVLADKNEPRVNSVKVYDDDPKQLDLMKRGAIAAMQGNKIIVSDFNAASGKFIFPQTSMQKYIDCLREGDVDQFSRNYIAHLKEVYEKSPLFDHNGKKRDFDDVRMAVLAIELAKTDIKPSDLKLAFHHGLMFETIKNDTLSRSGKLDDQAADIEQRMLQFRREATSATVCINKLNIKDNNQSLSSIYKYLETSRDDRHKLEEDIESKAGIPDTSKDVDRYKLNDDSYKQFVTENKYRSSVGKELKQRETDAEADKRSEPYLDMIRQLVAALPSTSRTKKIYDKILNDNNLRDYKILEDIVEAATKRYKVVEKREYSLFKNIDDSKSIHRALSAIVLKDEYNNSSFKTAADELIQQKKDRKDTLLKTLQDLGLPPITPRKKM